MHVPDHAAEPLDHVDPIPMPDTKEEAADLCLLLGMGLYPRCKVLSDRIESTSLGDGPLFPP